MSATREDSLRRILYDIEATGLLDCDAIDYSKTPYKIKDNYKVHCIVAVDIDTEEVFKFINDEGDVNQIPDFINLVSEECDTLCGHNIINFDLLALKLTYGLDYEINPNFHERLNINDKLEVYPDRLFGRKAKFVDTLLLSKLLNADRFPQGHALKVWGNFLNNAKGNYGEQDEAWDRYSPEMLEYCVQDVMLNLDVYRYLLKEMGDYTTNWLEAYQLEAATADLVTTSSHFGFNFNKERAENCIVDLDQKIKDITDKVNPQLPDRLLPKGKQPKPPNNPWKKAFDYKEPFTKSGKLKKACVDYLTLIGIEDGDEQLSYIRSMIDKEEIEGNIIFESRIEREIEKHKSLLSVAAISYCNKLNIEDCFAEIIRIQEGGEPKQLTDKMTLDNADDVKKHIVSLGWVPTKWNENDLLTKTKNQKRNKDEIETAILRYVKDTKGSIYEKYRCEKLKCIPETLETTIKGMVPGSHKVMLRSTPLYTVDKEKNICPNLEKMKDKVPFISLIIDFLVYSHRRRTILGKSGDTGWLANKRLEVDGKIPTPADTVGAITGRFKHRDVCNVPRPTSTYGKEMRGLFGVPKNHYLLTADADGLEGRQEGSHCYKYDGGPEYAVELEAPKPNDFHTVRAKKLNIDRNDAKSLKYGLSYGQQPAGLAKSMGWPLNKAKQIYNGFWESALPLKQLKDNLEKHWEHNGKKFIIGLDKRKLPARAKHLLINLLFQSSGIICMKRQHVMLDRMLKDEGLLGDPFKHNLDVEKKSTLIIMYHDESSQAIHKDLIRLKSFDTKEDAQKCKQDLEEKGFILSDINHGIPEICDGKYFIAWSKVIELTSKSMIMAGEYYNMNIKLTQAGQLGMDWSQTH